MALECGWPHARKGWSWEFEDFDKYTVGSWDWTMESSSRRFDHWVEELSFSDPYRQRWTEILNTTRCAERLGWLA